MKGLLSVVIPAFNEEKNIPNTVNAVFDALSKATIPFEMIFVDDGSTDNTFNILTQKSNSCDYIKIIRFSRNFGKESAIFAGLKKAKGDCCVVLDCDLQHPPETVVQMYNLWGNNGFLIVEGIKKSRGKESLLYKLSAGVFYKILKISSGINLKNASDFKLLDKKVVDIIINMPERQTFFRALSSWVGFNKTSVYFDVPLRKGEKSRFSFKNLLDLALTAISSFSTLPMQIVTFFGVLFFGFSLITLIQTLYMKLTGKAVEGFTTVIILLLVIGSIIMFSLGVIGIYIAKIYEEVKFRPKYIISEAKGFEEE